MTDEKHTHARYENSNDIKILALAVVAMLAIGAVYWLSRTPAGDDPLKIPAEETPGQKADADLAKDPTLAQREARMADPRFVNFGEVVFWWDAIPDVVRQASIASGPSSNMHKEDYVGAEACAKCHRKQYDQWHGHSHRRMNALADSENVEGNFSTGSIQYKGGVAEFYQDGSAYRMRLRRDDTTIVYDVVQTIGSRFFQYYIGRMIEGPFEPGHPYRDVNHVLPFGYWLDKSQWVPVVHVGPELPDDERDDPFAPRQEPLKGETFLPYASNCSVCHTTFPLADDLTRKPTEIARHAPMRMHWNMSEYFKEHHPEIWGDHEHSSDVPTPGIHEMPQRLMTYEADEHAVNLGISCEACHLGGREHAENPKIRPDFHPHSPHLLLETKSGQLDTGRVHQNVNWACGRCHVGGRPQFAGGMSTWNSVEYSDAMLGSCYSELRCVDCHSPHQGTGARWTATAIEDDAKCVRCHPKFNAPETLVEHTHHAADSSGSRCLNCHMPHLNEGLQDVVRTHTIYSPTLPAMIEANHPNACNLCHLDQSIDWTVAHLKDWYGASFDEQKLNKAYAARGAAVGKGWLENEYEPVRLVAAAAVMRQNERSLLPELVSLLDDPYLLNRQFAQQSVEKMTGLDCGAFGYRFYMTGDERQGPLERIRKAILAAKPQAGSIKRPPLEERLEAETEP